MVYKNDFLVVHFSPLVDVEELPGVVVRLLIDSFEMLLVLMLVEHS
jgi:hypothetical protein